MRENTGSVKTDLHISLTLEPGGIVTTGPDESTGTMTLYAYARLDFTGIIPEMAGTLSEITQEQIAGALAGAMVDLLGEEIVEGGCHVQG
jgi:hypothetical protein